MKWKRLGLMFLFSLIGFFDSIYLFFKHILGEIPPCSLVSGCESVLQSAYAEIMGFPVAGLGAFYYLTLIILLVLFFDKRRGIFLFFATRMTILGFLASLWFVYLQVFVIGAICFYCMISATVSVFNLLLAASVCNLSLYKAKAPK